MNFSNSTNSKKEKNLRILVATMNKGTTLEWHKFSVSLCREQCVGILSIDLFSWKISLFVNIKVDQGLKPGKGATDEICKGFRIHCIIEVKTVKAFLEI